MERREERSKKRAERRKKREERREERERRGTREERREKKVREERREERREEKQKEKREKENTTVLSPALGNQICVRMKVRLGGKRINVDFVLAVVDLVLPVLSRRRAFMSRGCGHMTESYQPSIQMLMMTPAHFHDAAQCATNKQLKDIVVVVGTCCEKISFQKCDGIRR